MSERQNLIASSIDFITAITENFGADRGIDLWEKISEVLDPDLKGEIFFAMLTRNFGNITLSGSKNLDIVVIKKVEIVRTIRSFTKLNLKEAIQLLDQLILGKSITLECDPLMTNQFMKELRLLGLKL